MKAAVNPGSASVGWRRTWCRRLCGPGKELLCRGRQPDCSCACGQQFGIPVCEDGLLVQMSVNREDGGEELLETQVFLICSGRNREKL